MRSDDHFVKLEEERHLRGYLENELEEMKAKKVEWQRLVRGNLMQISVLEEQLWCSEAATEDVLQEVEDLKIELDEERRLNLENELAWNAQKDGGLKTLCHCDKDNTWRRSLGGTSVDSHESTRVDNEDLLERTRPETKRQAAKPEVFHIADSEDEAEVSLMGSDLKSLDEGSFPLTEPSASMPRSENWRCGTKSDKQTYVADADRDGRNGTGCDAINASDASSPGEGPDRNSLQTDFLSEEVADEMMEMPQIEHQNQVQVVQEQDGFLPQGLWPRLLSFLPVNEVMKMQTRAVSHFFSDSKAWVAPFGPADGP
eukprot:Skav214164  [mRNA]  locus=scaffold945:186685:188265:- [translate_table: standard]